MDGLAILGDILGYIWAVVIWVDRRTLKWSRPTRRPTPCGIASDSGPGSQTEASGRPKRLGVVLVIAGVAAGAILLIRATT